MWHVLNIGGCDIKGVPIKAAEVYDFATKKWTVLPDMPTKRASASAAVVRNNKIIVVGGLTQGQTTVAAVDCFNIETQKWEDFPSLPIGVVGPYVKLVDDKLYVIGGTDKKNCNQSVVFDFDKNTWLDLPPKPTPAYSCGGHLYDRKLFIVGGRGGPKGETPITAVDAFDLDTQQWESMSSMYALRVFCSIVGIEEEIYVIGGFVPMVGVCKIVEKYNIHEDMWARICDLSECRTDAVCGVVGNRVVMTGGIGPAPELKPLVSGEAIGYKGKRFKNIPPISKPRTSMTSFSFDGKLAAINGVGHGGPQSTIEILSVKDKNA